MSSSIRKLILNKPVELVHVELVVPREVREKVLSELRSVENLHVEKVGEKEVEELKKRAEETKRLLEMVLYLLKKSEERTIEASLTVMELESYTLEHVKRDVEPLFQEVQSLENEVKRLEDLKKMTSELLEHIKVLPRDMPTSMLRYKGKVHSSMMIAGKRGELERASRVLRDERISKVYESIVDDSFVWVIVYPSNIEEEVVSNIELAGLYCVPDEMLKTILKFKDVAQLSAELQSEVARMAKQIDDLRAKARELVRANLQWLGRYYLFLKALAADFEELQKLWYLKHLALIRGWVPKEEVARVIEHLKRSGYPHYLMHKEPRKDEVPPTKMANAKGIDNFEIITELYGVPNYWEWDPTPLVAYSFAFFFGLMVSDVGYSAIGLLLILLFLDKLVTNKEDIRYKKFKKILLTSNVIALIFGMLTGAVFGNLLEEYFGLGLPVILAFMSSPMSFITVSLLIGLVHVNISHVLTLVKSIKRRDVALALQEVGILGMQVFGIPLVLRMFFDYDVPLFSSLPSEALLAGTLLNVSLIVVSSVMVMKMLGLMTWIFQITGVLGDVLSYVRLAGVGLATYYIAFSFNFIVKMLLNWFASLGNVVLFALGLLLSVALLALTHLISLVLSILGGFVHSLRLCFLEFLSKFYEGNGSPFVPLKRVLSEKIILA